MLEEMLKIGWSGLLTFSVVMAVISLSVLIFKEYTSQRKNHDQRLSSMEELVQTEIDRSQKLSNQVGKLSQIKEKTKEQLDLIRLQVKSIEKGIKK